MLVLVLGKFGNVMLDGAPGVEADWVPGGVDEADGVAGSSVLVGEPLILVVLPGVVGELGGKFGRVGDDSWRGSRIDFS